MNEAYPKPSYSVPWWIEYSNNPSWVTNEYPKYIQTANIPRDIKLRYDRVSIWVKIKSKILLCKLYFI
jgi:hypothetical protein